MTSDDSLRGRRADAALLAAAALWAVALRLAFLATSYDHAFFQTPIM